MNEIRPISGDEFPSDGIFVYAVGYERRSSHFLRSTETYAPNDVFAFDYGPDSSGLHSYDENLRIAGEKARFCSESLQKLCQALEERINRGTASITLDVTSLDREKMALIIKFLFSLKSEVSHVRFVYCPSEYRDPNFSLETVRSFAPVIPEFAGDVGEARRKIALILGVGYEYGRTIGAIEALEPEKIHAFMPVGTDPRFEDKIIKNNLDFEFLQNTDVLKQYSLAEIGSLYSALRSSVETEIAKRSVLILPLGPKIFAALAILIAMVKHPSVMVWRHSSTSANRPDTTSNAEASGLICEFAFKFV